MLLKICSKLAQKLLKTCSEFCRNTIKKMFMTNSIKIAQIKFSEVLVIKFGILSKNRCLTWGSRQISNFCFWSFIFFRNCLENASKKTRPKKTRPKKRVQRAIIMLLQGYYRASNSSSSNSTSSSCSQQPAASSIIQSIICSIGKIYAKGAA